MSDVIGIDKELYRNVFRLVENRFSVIAYSGPIGYIDFQILADIRGFLNIPIRAVEDIDPEVGKSTSSISYPFCLKPAGAVA